MKLKAFFNSHLTVFRVIAAVIAFAMTAGLLWFANGLLGNPVSYFIARNNAKKYVAENYADKGYVLKDIGYNFKTAEYYANVEKPGREDCTFGLSYTMGGKLRFDTYQRNVEEGYNTRYRLNRSYWELVNNTTDTPAFPYLCYGALIFVDDSYFGEPFPFGLSKELLIPDAQYSINELAAEAGHLEISAIDDDPTAERAAEILREVDGFMERSSVEFRAISLSIDAAGAGSDSYSIRYFLREDIHADNLVELVEDNHQQTEEFFANLQK